MEVIQDREHLLVQHVQLVVMVIVLKHLGYVHHVQQVMDIQVEHALNVKLDIIHHQEVHQHVNNVVQHHGQMQDQHHVQLVLDVLLVLDQQENVMVVMLDMDMILQIRNVPHVLQESFQQEKQIHVRIVIQYVKHVILKQVIV